MNDTKPLYHVLITIGMHIKNCIGDIDKITWQQQFSKANKKLMIQEYRNNIVSSLSTIH